MADGRHTQPAHLLDHFPVRLPLYVAACWLATAISPALTLGQTWPESQFLRNPYGTRPLWQAHAARAGRHDMGWDLCPVLPANWLQEVTGDDLRLAEPTDSTAEESEGSEEGEEEAKESAEKDASDDEANDIFQEPIVLYPGQKKIRTTYAYMQQTFQYPITLSDGSLGLERDRVRQFTITPDLRFGLTSRTEGHVRLPLRYLQVEYSSLDFDVYDSEAGLGDIVAGVSHLLWPDGDESTSLVGSLDVMFPTGGDPFGLSSYYNAISSGFWGISAGLSWAHTDEEFQTWYAGGAYTHYFPATYFATEVEKADVYSVWMGTNYYLTEKTSLSAEFYLDYQGNFIYDGVEWPGTSIEPLGLRLALGHDRGHGRRLEPFVQFGLNEDRRSVTIGISTSQFFPCPMTGIHGCRLW